MTQPYGKPEAPELHPPTHTHSLLSCFAVCFLPAPPIFKSYYLVISLLNLGTGTTSFAYYAVFSYIRLKLEKKLLIEITNKAFETLMNSPVPKERDWNHSRTLER